MGTGGVASLVRSCSRVVAFTGLALGDVAGGEWVAQAAEMPAPNPPIAKACGIDVSLVLDTSGSVESAHAVGDVRDAAAELLDALKDTGSTARVLQFATLAQELARASWSTTSAWVTTETSTTPSTVTSTRSRNGRRTSRSAATTGAAPALEGNWVTSNSSIQYTNWQQALDLTATDTAELVVFITDGDPTGYDFDRPADPFDQGPPPMSGSAPTAPPRLAS